MSTPDQEFDVYQSSLARSQLDYDHEDHRLSLYTNTKPDHRPNLRTGGPCNCERGDTTWEESGVAMRVTWPPAPDRSGGSSPLEQRGTAARTPPRKSTARGRSR